MKTYDEMTQSVLQRATAGIAERNRRRKTILTVTATGLCLTLILAVVAMFWKAPTTTDPNPTVFIENPTTEPKQEKPNAHSRVVYLRKIDGEEMETPLVSGLKMPLDIFVYVRDLRGMNEEQRQEAVKEWERVRENLVDPEYCTVSTVYVGENAIVATFMRGTLSVTVDLSTVQAMYVDSANNEVAEKGWGWRGDDFLMSWFLKNDALEENPDLPLSSFHDTINIVIMYRDGTTETIPVDISLNDEGQVFATLVEKKGTV